MSFSTITPSQLNSRGATTLPDQPTISATALKQEFDAPAKNIVAPAFNNLITELEASTSAGNLGAVAPTGRTGNKVQTVIDSISNDLAAVEVDMPGLVTNEHNHANKALLDTYEQTETDLADAVSKKHSHANKALLDTYTQTEANLADAVTKKHSHANKTELDKIGESGGRPTYDGNDIGGSVNNTFNKVKVGTTTLNASNEDTLELVAGTNVSLVPDATNKKVTILSTGGSGGGDMLKAVYDTNNNNIVDKAETLNDGTTALTASITELNYVDGVTSAIQTQLNSKADSSDLPTIDQTYDGTSTNPQSGTAVAEGIEKRTHEIVVTTLADTAADGYIIVPAPDTSGGSVTYNYDIHIKNTSTIIPVADIKSNGTPYKFKSVVVTTGLDEDFNVCGYVKITMAETLPSGSKIGVVVINQ